MQSVIDEAQHLEFEKPPASKYYLSVISQEESAKAFLLYLSKNEIVPWNRFILRAISDHCCKQLVGVIIDYLCPDTDKFFEWAGDRSSSKWELPRSVSDAINILRYEKIERWKSTTWIWADDVKYDSIPNQIARGKIDRQKQASLYVNISETAGIISTPEVTTEKMANEELEKANRFLYFGKSISKNEKGHLINYNRIENGFKELFKVSFE